MLNNHKYSCNVKTWNDENRAIFPWFFMLNIEFVGDHTINKRNSLELFTKTSVIWLTQLVNLKLQTNYGDFKWISWNISSKLNCETLCTSKVNWSFWIDAMHCAHSTSQSIMYETKFADWEIKDGIGNRMGSNECQHWHSFWLFV